MKHLLVAVASTMFFVPQICAQTVVEDATGQSALLLPVGGYVGINTAEKSIELGWYRSTSTVRWVPGLSIQGSAKDGIGTLFKGGTVQPGVSIESLLGYKITAETFVGAKYSRGWQEAVIATPTAEKVVMKDLLRTWNVSGHLTSMFHERIGLGVSFARQKHNNYADLRRTSLTTIRRYDRSDGTEVEIRSTTDAREGTVAEGHTSWLNADVVLLPFRDLPRVMLRAFGRGVVSRDSTVQPRSSFGLDVAVHDGDPILGRTIAVIFQLSEVLPSDAAENRDFADRIQIGVVADAKRLAGLLASTLRN